MLQVYFAPHYLKNSVINNIKLSDYDNADHDALNNLMYDMIRGKQQNTNLTKTHERMTCLYTTNSNLVFNDTEVTLCGKKVFDITHKIDMSNYDYIINDMIIFCNVGCLQTISHCNFDSVDRVSKWLVDYMVNEVGIIEVINSFLFKCYWLKNTK